MRADVFKKIYGEHIKQLKNLDVPHEKVVICFSGVPGSGKTYISEILERKYKGVRIRNDTIREILERIDKTLDKDKDTYAYTSLFFDSYEFENKLFILDQGIDRKYEEIFSFFKEKGYKVFVIRLEVPREVYDRRIVKKLGDFDQNYFNRIDDWIRQHKEFGENVESDIVIHNDKDDELDLSSLFEKLDKIIS